VIYRGSGLPFHLSFCLILWAVIFPAAAQENPDWIPVGSVPPEVVRRAVEMRARFESQVPEFQRAALRTIRDDIPRYGRATMRLAAAPLVIDLLSMEYRILETPRDYRIDAQTRLQALITLADLGGAPARDQLRSTLRDDSDGAIRSSAAALLADVPGGDPDLDYRAVGDAVARAVRAGSDDGELQRLIAAAQILSYRVWNPEYPPLLQALVQVAGGSYSSSTRNAAMSFLEDLVDR
jgi:hypothetical protein